MIKKNPPTHQNPPKLHHLEIPTTADQELHNLQPHDLTLKKIQFSISSL